MCVEQDAARNGAKADRGCVENRPLDPLGAGHLEAQDRAKEMAFISPIAGFGSLHRPRMSLNLQKLCLDALAQLV